MPFRTESLDYIQGLAAYPGLPSQGPFSSAPLEKRRLWCVRGLGRYSKLPEHVEPDKSLPPSQDLLVGLYGYKIPLAFWVRCDPGGVAFNLGTWSPAEREAVSPATLDRRQNIVATVLKGLYPLVEIDTAPAGEEDDGGQGGLVLGIPGWAKPEREPGLANWDRLLRAMAGSQWECLILAEPVNEAFLIEVRNGLINEIRGVAAAAQAEKAESPLAKHYTQMLEQRLEDITLGLRDGAWRTAVYLLGWEQNYHRLASVWRGVFSGMDSGPESLRVHADPQAAALARAWAQPDAPPLPGPGAYQRPFLHQSLLNSLQLSQYIHFPRMEHIGLYRRLVPEYDVVPPALKSGETLSLGMVCDRGRQSQTPYAMDLGALDRHGLVVGVTGSGKTNTIFYLLRQIREKGLPFMVLEPAKTEYRSLLGNQAMAPGLHVFSAGREQISPLRLNPFEVEPGLPVATHMDLLKSLFNASFGMWNPLPQVLERCVHEIYRACGWDPVRDFNRRLSREQTKDEKLRALSFPTLSDLYQKVDEVVDGLGYEARVTSDIKAALMTRVNALRIGGKGTMLDVRRSTPMAELLGSPTIVELEEIGDDDEKAFIMGLLLIKIYEHLRIKGSVEGAGLGHVVVIEEAHRLLTATPPAADQEQVNIRAKAVKAFVNMLSEVRAYGQGFIVAEQIPAKLAPDVIKNTNLKVVHRTVAGDDRTTMGQAMNMNPAQCEMLATLETGQAAIFTQGDDRPVLVQVPYAKIKAPAEFATRARSDALVAEHMKAWRQRPEIAELMSPGEMCAKYCTSLYAHCQEAERLLESGAVRRRTASLLLAAGDGFEQVPGALAALFKQARSQARGRWSQETARCLLLKGLEWNLAHLGRLYGWNYAEQAAMTRQLSAALIDMTEGQGAELALSARQALIDYRVRLANACLRGAAPYPACAEICPQGSCLYRYVLRLFMSDKRRNQMFSRALDQASQKGVWRDWQALEEIMNSALPHGSEQTRRNLGLCYGMQRVMRAPGLLWAARELAVGSLIQSYDRHYFDSSPAPLGAETGGD